MLRLFGKKKGSALSGSRGFTLVELLVVIAIIGLLASVVLVSMTGARKSARDSRRKADMRQLITAQEMYYGNNDQYYQRNVMPIEIKDLTNTYMATVPKDPQTKAAYGWIDNSAAANKDKFCAYTLLEETGAGGAARYYTASHGGNFCLQQAAAPGTFDLCAGIGATTCP